MLLRERCCITCWREFLTTYVVFTNIDFEILKPIKYRFETRISCMHFERRSVKTVNHTQHDYYSDGWCLSGPLWLFLSLLLLWWWVWWFLSGHCIGTVAGCIRTTVVMTDVVVFIRTTVVVAGVVVFLSLKLYRKWKIDTHVQIDDRF